MKLAIITDEVTQDVRTAVEFAKRHRLSGLEIRSVENMNIDALPLGRVKEIKKIISDEGLEVCNLSSSFFKCQIDDRKQYEDNLEKLKLLIERAHILGCKTIRGFSFFRNGSFETRLPEIVDKFRQPVGIILREGVELLLEADPSVFTTNHAGLAVLLEAIGCKAVNAIYDPGNDIYDPDHESPYPEGFHAIARHIRHVHVKDARIDDGKPESVKVGTGSVPFEAIFKELYGSGYRGYVSLETHYRKDAAIPEELMVKPGGNLFSSNGEAASEESVIELKKLIADYLR